MIRFGKPDAKAEHTYFEERLSAYLDGELLPQEQAAVEHHLATCQACQWDLDTVRQTVQWTRELPTLTVPRVFTIPAPAEPERAARRRWRFVPVMQGATALIALLLFFVVASDFLLVGSFRQAGAPEPMMMQATVVVEAEEVAPAEEAVMVVETVEVEAPVEEVVTVVETVVVEVAVEAEKVAAEPTEAPLPAAAEPAEPTEAPLPTALPRAATATPTARATGIEGAAAEIKEEAALEPPAVEAPQAAAPPAGETQTFDAVGAGGLTPTLAATLSSTVAPTVLAEARKPALLTRDEQDQAEADTWGVRDINWLRVAEYVLGVAFVAFTAGTLVAMLLQRRVP
jgi:predicted anti-sigma-YlaC factor YlaD